MTDAEHNGLSRDWHARLDEFEAGFAVMGDAQVEIGHAREVLADDLRRTRRRLYLALAMAMATTMVQTAVIVALLLR